MPIQEKPSKPRRKSGAGITVGGRVIITCLMTRLTELIKMIKKARLYGMRM